MSSAGNGTAPPAGGSGQQTNPAAPGDVVAGLVVEAAGPITWLWVVAFLFGNLFAGFWLVRAFLNAHPEVAYQAGCLLARLGLQRRRRSQHPGAEPGASRAKRPADADGGGAGKASALPESPVKQRAARAQGAFAANGHAAAAAAAAGGTAACAPGSPKRRSFSAGSGGRPSGELVGSPLRMQRSRPAPPPELCQDQSLELELTSITPRTSGTPGGGWRSPRPAPSPRPAGKPGGGGSSEQGGASSGSSSRSDALDDGSEVSVQLVRLEWHNLCFAVRSPQGRRLIVQSVYGCANPQELQGLMGPSGAGKSTLMDLLAMRTDNAAAGAPSAKASARVARLPGAKQGAPARAAGPLAEAAEARPAAVQLPLAELEAAAAAAARAGSASGVPGLPGGEEALGVAGQLLVNGQQLKRRAFMALSAYVPQHDNLVPTMTAYEALSFYASIILPPGTPPGVRRGRIARVLAMMGLTAQQHTLVGGTLAGGIMLRGMSGGERKRLAIACGVVAGPSLVFLDEPTSGLDSFAALNVVLFLKSMASQGGATLIASLHQPRSAIWGQLDQVTLLASGRLMYTGPTEGLVPWFSSLGYAHDPEAHGMASDWALDLVSLGFDKSAATQQRIADAAHAPGAGGGRQLRQRPAAGGSGARGLPPAGAGAGAGGAQQGGMMSGKAELEAASAAFLQHLRSAHPDWFGGSAAAAAAEAAADSGAAALVQQQQQQLADGAPPGLAPIQTRAPAAAQPDAAKAAAAAGVVGEAGPFAQQQQQQGAGLGGDTNSEGSGGSDGAEPRGGLGGLLRGAWHKYKALLWRELLITTRNPADIGGRMLTFTYVSMLSGLTAWNLPFGADSIFQRMSICYAVLSFYLLMPFVFMSLFTSDKRFFAADTTARLYHPAQYYAAKVTISMPFNILVGIVFHLVYFGMVGMRHGPGPMAASCTISVLMGLVAMQSVYCCAILASSQDLAFVYAIAWTALNLLVNPYMAMFQGYSLGWGFSWLRFFSPYNFAWQALVKIELGGRGFDCNSGSGVMAIGLVPDLLPNTSRFNLVRNSMANLGPLSTNGTCIASGDAVVAMYTNNLPFGATVGILLGYLLLFLAVTYLVIARSAKKRGQSL